MINHRRIPENGDPWRSWVTEEIKFLHDEVKAQREELKAQREELKAQRKVQRNIITVLDQHGRMIAGLAVAIRDLQRTTRLELHNLRQEMRQGFNEVGKALQLIIKRLP